MTTMNCHEDSLQNKLRRFTGNITLMLWNIQVTQPVQIKEFVDKMQNNV